MQWHPTPVLLPGKSHGRRSLVGCSPWDLEESDTNERLHFHFSLSRIGEENGNPLQCSCLKNPRDGGAWWAAVHGVTQSRTRLKRLSAVGVCKGHLCLCVSTPGCIFVSGTHLYVPECAWGSRSTYLSGTQEKKDLCMRVKISGCLCVVPSCIGACCVHNPKNLKQQQ